MSGDRQSPRWWTKADSMATFLFRCADKNPPVSLIAHFRELTQLSIGDIRQRISDRAPIIEITPFRNDWHESRHLLVRLSRAIDDGLLPLTVAESLDGNESDVPPEMLRHLIQRYRGIAFPQISAFPIFYFLV